MQSKLPAANFSRSPSLPALSCSPEDFPRPIGVGHAKRKKSSPLVINM